MASERQSYKMEMESIVEKMNEIFMDIQDLKRRGIKEHQKSSKAQEKKAKLVHHVSEDVSKCGLCKRLKGLNIKPRDNKHHLSRRGNPEPESCGQLRDMNIKEMAELYKNYEMCRVCAYRPISESHQEEKCNYTTRVKLAKCKNKDCRYRYFLCDQHIDENKSSIQDRKEYYKRNNFPVTFTPSLKIDVSTQTIDDLLMEPTTAIPESDFSPEKSTTDSTK